MAEKLRVIFQGGGARVATLLAAARALQRVCRDDYEIVEAVGVSAGSIAAAAVVGGVSISDVRSRMLKQADKYSGYIRIFKGPHTGNKGWLSRIGTLVMLPWTILKYVYLTIVIVVFGGAFISEKSLSRALTKVFARADGKPLRVTDAPKLVVFSTLLNRASPRRYPDPHGGDDTLSIGEVLARSCKLPLIFAGYRTKAMEVDGGIAGNLPIHDVIDARRDESLRTLVFSFPNDETEVRGFVAFVTRLLSASIDASVKHARAQAHETGAAVCSLPSELGTFDFQGAIDALAADPFNQMVEELEPKIERHLKDLFGPFGYPLIRPTRFTREHVAGVFDELALKHPYEKLYSARIMIDKGLRRPGLNRDDERCYVDTFQPGERFEVCQIGLPFNLTAGPAAFDEPAETASGSITNLVVRVSVDNQEIRARPFLSFDGEKNRILIFISDDLRRFRASDGSLPQIKVLTRIDGPVFGSFVQRGWDAFSTRSTLGGSLGRLDWICLFNGRKALTVKDMVDLEAEQLDQVVPHTVNLRERLNSWVRGCALDAASIDQLVLPYCGETIPPQQWDTVSRVGWRVEGLGNGTSAGFRFDAS